MFEWLESKLIYFPSRYPDGEWNPPDLAFQDVEFRAADGVRLHGWRCSTLDRPCVVGGTPRPVFFYFHGNAGNLSDRVDNIRRLQWRLGVDVFIFDYRGYGKSEGSPSERGLYRDAEAAYDCLTRSWGVPADRIVFLGRSLGAAVATKLALERPHRAMIVESAFTSLPDIAAELYPFLPVRWLMRTRLPTIDHVRGYRQPVLIVHGEVDSLIPRRHAEQLFAAANEPKRLLIVPGADHNDVCRRGGEAYFAVVRQFLADAFRDVPIATGAEASAP